MKMYKLHQGAMQQQFVIRLADNAFIPFNPANTDYQTFKKQINEETTQLEDADGNLMTEQQAKDFVATLP